MVFQFKNGLNFVFKQNDQLILNDDSFVSPQFFNFCTQLLLKFKNDNSIGQINLTNLSPLNLQIFLILSKRPVIWGFATWKRVWKSYDLQMSKWSQSNQKKFSSIITPVFEKEEVLRKCLICIVITPTPGPMIISGTLILCQNQCFQ